MGVEFDKTKEKLCGRRPQILSLLRLDSELVWCDFYGFVLFNGELRTR